MMNYRTREKIKEHIRMFVFSYIILPIMCFILGRYFKRIIQNGDFGRRHHKP